jgi:hypothetical protein
MTKTEAEAITQKIVDRTGEWFYTIAPLMIRMEREEGYLAMGFKNFRDFCKSLDGRTGKMSTPRLMDRARVEASLGMPKIPAEHAYILAELPTDEARKEVYEAVLDEYEKPIARNFRTRVDRWFREHTKSSGRSSDDGWSESDLEADPEIAKAFARIEQVYSRADRQAIQDGGVKLTRKEIIALAAFHASKMNEVRHLIMVNHWGVEESFKFINKTPDSRTMIEELMNHCLTTPGFYYTCSVNGFDISVKACKSLTGKLRA